MKKLWLMLAMIVCVLAACSDGGSDNPVNPTPKPEEVKTEITIDSGIISNGLSFASSQGEQSISFSVNADWTLSVASTTSGATWCKASATSGSKGSANVKFTIDENTSYDDRSVSVTIKAGMVSKTFTITQKGTDAMLVTTTKYEVAQDGGQIEVEVKANVDYQLAISETAKDWITEAKSKSRGLTTYKHTFDIAMNEEAEKREGEITFKSGDKVETVKVYQAGGAIILLTQNEYTVSDAGETISVDIKSNVDFGVQMPDVDWITDEASSRGMSSHTLKYVIAANEGYDSRLAEIIFYDKNSDLKDTLKVVQAQKDAIVISQKNFSVTKEGGMVEVKVNTNVDFEVQIPSDVTWVTLAESRALTEKSIWLKVVENTDEVSRSVTITITNKDSQLSEAVVVNQQGNVTIVTLKEAGTMKQFLGNDFLNISSLKVVGPINGDDVYFLRMMSGGNEFKENIGELKMLDLSEAFIVEGGGWYSQGWFYINSNTQRYLTNYTSNNVIGDYMFQDCELNHVILPSSVESIGYRAFAGTSLTTITLGDKVTKIGGYSFYSSSLTSIIIPDNVEIVGEKAFAYCPMKTISIGANLLKVGWRAFEKCDALTSIYIKDLSLWMKIDGLEFILLCEGGRLYLNDEILTDLTIPENITEIKGRTFFNCDELRNVKMGEKVTTIGEFSFADCDSLFSVTIGKNVTIIQTGAFENCNSLPSIAIGENVSTIGPDAFAYCKSLSSVIIGKNVAGIGKNAFKNCEKIKQIYSYAITAPSIGYDAFGGIGTATLYIPKGSYRSYVEAGWNKWFKNIDEMD